MKYNEYLSYQHSILKSCARKFLPGYLEEVVSIIIYLDFYLFYLIFLFFYSNPCLISVSYIPIRHLSDLTTFFHNTRRHYACAHNKIVACPNCITFEGEANGARS